MRKLSEYKDEEALDLLADILEPAIKIFADPAFAGAIITNKRVTAVKIAAKNHKREVMEILAAMEGVPIDEYHCNVLTLPMRLLDIINDEGLQAVFTSQVQEKKESTSSGPVTENTGDAEN